MSITDESARPPGATARSRWDELRALPLERVLFALAGTVTLTSALLAAVVSPWFLLLTAFVGVNQWLYVLLHGCPASLVLKRTCGFSSSLYSERPRGEAIR